MHCGPGAFEVDVRMTGEQRHGFMPLADPSQLQCPQLQLGRA